MAGLGFVAPGGDGTIEVHIDEQLREVVGEVLGQLRDALVADTDDPLLARLFPPAYADDPEKEAGFRALARDELLEARLAAIDTVEASLSADTLTFDEGGAWLRALNALRLVLGTRLDVQEDDSRRRIADDDPDAPAWALYELLTQIVDDLVQVLPLT
jgi:hypothetical protein